MKDARVHPRTVSEFSRGGARAPRGRAGRARAAAPAVTVTQVHPTVWAGVLAARRPGDRIEILSPTRVLIHHLDRTD